MICFGGWGRGSRQVPTSHQAFPRSPGHPINFLSVANGKRPSTEAEGPHWASQARTFFVLRHPVWVVTTTRPLQARHYASAEGIIANVGRREGTDASKAQNMSDLRYERHRFSMPKDGDLIARVFLCSQPSLETRNLPKETNPPSLPTPWLGQRRRPGATAPVALPSWRERYVWVRASAPAGPPPAPISPACCPQSCPQQQRTKWQQFFVPFSLLFLKQVPVRPPKLWQR